MPSLELVIGGGQTGADQAGWRSARKAGLATGGWMPKGFKTEAGPRPEFAGLYGAKEHRSFDYAVRRRANLDLTAMHGGSENGLAVIFDTTPKNKGQSPGTRGIYNDRDDLHRRNDLCPSLVTVRLVPTQDGFRVTADSHEPDGLVWAIDHCRAKALMVAGNRESSAPGIGVWVESYLDEVFRIMREMP